VITVILLTLSIFYYSVIVTPYFSVLMTIDFLGAFGLTRTFGFVFTGAAASVPSITAMRLYRILKVFKMLGFLGSGVLKHK
jgi:hypothetical protein